jgi:hypothetical protein
VEGPDNFSYDLIVRRIEMPADVGLAWTDGPDGKTVMLFPASEITEHGARLLEEASVRRRQQLIDRAGGRKPWQVEAERRQREEVCREPDSLQ